MDPVKAVPTLQSLKAMLQEQAPLRTRRELGFLMSDGSIPLHAGQVIEVLGKDQLAWSVRFLKERSQAKPLTPEVSTARVAWISSGLTEVFPMALAQEKIALSRILFLERVKPEQGMEVLLSVLRSQLFEVLVFDQPLLPMRNLDAQMRKLQLTAEEGGSLMLLLSQKPTSSFGIHIQVVAEEQGQAHLRKVKGGTSE